MSFDPIDIHVGNRVKSLRKQKQLTQQNLAMALGLTFQQVQKYERGANRISASKLFMIAETLKSPISWFFEDLDDENDSETSNGFAEAAEAFQADAVNEVLDFASSDEGIELNRGFAKISDAKTRKFLVGLFDAIAKAE